MGLDYYGILECTQSDSDQEINNAYRNLSLKFHPLKNPTLAAIARFELISEAYEALSNPIHKAIYDHFGEEGLKAGVPFEHDDGIVYIEKFSFQGNPHRTFEKLFGGDNPWEQYFSHQDCAEIYSLGGIGRRNYEEITKQCDLPLSLTEMFTGCEKKLRPQDVGLEEDADFKNKRVIVKPGVLEGTKFCFPPPIHHTEKTYLNIILVAKEIPHDHLKRDGIDLIHESKISLLDALTGCAVKIETLDGRTLNIQINDIITPGYKKVVEGEGMPLYDNLTERGNLILTFDIVFPKKLSKNDKKNLKNVFKSIEMK